jgi:hypothetical protein
VVNAGPAARNDSTATSTDNSANEKAMVVVVSKFGTVNDKAGTQVGEVRGEKKKGLCIQCNM